MEIEKFKEKVTIKIEEEDFAPMNAQQNVSVLSMNSAPLLKDKAGLEEICFNEVPKNDVVETIRKSLNCSKNEEIIIKFEEDSLSYPSNEPPQYKIQKPKNWSKMMESFRKENNQSVLSMVENVESRPSNITPNEDESSTLREASKLQRSSTCSIPSQLDATFPIEPTVMETNNRTDTVENRIVHTTLPVVEMVGNGCGKSTVVQNRVEHDSSFPMLNQLDVSCPIEPTGMGTTQTSTAENKTVHTTLPGVEMGKLTNVKNGLEHGSSCSVPNQLDVLCPVEPTVAESNQTSTVENKTILTTLPDVQMGKSTVVKNGLGVFATKFIPKGTNLGASEGKKTNEADNTNTKKISFMWKIMIDGKVMYCVDAKDEKYGNWLRLINQVKDRSIINVKRFEDNGKVCYKTSKDIKVGEEVLVCDEKNDTPSDDIIEASKDTEDIGPIFKCRYCQMSFSEETFLTKHSKYCKKMRAVKDASRGNPSQCDICGKEFMWKSNLEIHRGIHTKEKPFKCDICGNKFQQKSHLKRHLLKIHKLQKCHVCGEEFIGFSALKIHKCMKNMRTMLKCNVCANEFDDMNALREHSCAHEEIRVNSDKRDNSLAESLNLIGDGQTSTGLNQHSCENYGKGFPCDKEHEIHLRILADEKIPVIRDDCNAKPIECTNQQTDKQQPTEFNQYECESCGKMFPRDNEYKIHLRSHITNSKKTPVGSDERNGETNENTENTNLKIDIQTTTGLNQEFRCKSCGKMFHSRKLYKAHMRVEKHYKCDICNFAFNRRYHLNRHLRVHTGEKPYICGICGKKYGDGGSLERHTRVHTGKRPYKCSICGETFQYARTFKNHVLKHAEDKSIHKDNICGKKQQIEYLRKRKNISEHQCDTCGKKFKFEDRFQRHVAKHTGEALFKCNTCGVDFDVRDSFLKHVGSHTGEKPFKCSECGKTFSRMPTLKNHFRTRHIVFPTLSAAPQMGT